MYSENQNEETTENSGITENNGFSQYDTTYNNDPFNTAYENMHGDDRTYTTYTATGSTSPIIEKSNRGLGIIGAVLGALLGVGLWILLGVMGYYAGYVAAVIYILAIWGYQKLGGKEEKFRNVICGVITLVSIIPANWIAYSISLTNLLNKELGHRFTYGDVLIHFPLYVNRYVTWTNFLIDLVIGFIVSFITIYSVLSGKRKI